MSNESNNEGSETRDGLCRICESLCGLDPHEFYDSPDRLQNRLVADGPDAIEKISGMANLTGFPADVFPAAGPRTKEGGSRRTETAPGS